MYYLYYLRICIIYIYIYTHVLIYTAPGSPASIGSSAPGRTIIYHNDVFSPRIVVLALLLLRFVLVVCLLFSVSITSSSSSSSRSSGSNSSSSSNVTQFARGRVSLSTSFLQELIRFIRPNGSSIV